MSTRFLRSAVRGSVAALLTTLIAAGQLPAAVSAPEMDPGWPREITKGGRSHLLPSADRRWKNYAISRRASPSRCANGGKPALGVATLHRRRLRIWKPEVVIRHPDRERPLSIARRPRTTR